MKNLVVKIIGLVVILIILVNNIVIAASSKSELEQQKNSTNQKINETKEELQQVQSEKSETMHQVEDISNQISDYQNQINELDSKIDELNSKITEAENNLKQAEDNYKDQEKLLKERLIASYEAGTTTYLDVILSSKSLTDFISNYYLVNEIATNDKKLLESIQEQKNKIESAKNTLEESKKELNTSKASKQNITNKLEVTKKEKNQYVDKLSGDEKQLQAEIDELQAHESSISSKIKKMQEEYDRQLAASRNQKAPSGSSSGGSTGGSLSGGGSSSYGFGWPVANPSIGTAYGEPGKWWSLGYHTGLDFRASTGTPVYSVGDGQVVDVGHTGAYGNSVTIYHGGNIFSLYAHASSVQVSIGQRVSKGQQIMLSGATGNVSGPHLHFEIRTPENSYYKCVNPRPYLP